MIDKHKRITKLINLVDKIFGTGAFIIRDHWDDFYAIGLEREGKLIYISTYQLKSNHYFYECEILLDDEDVVYSSHSKDNNVSEENLINVIEKFFKAEKSKYV